MKEKTLYKGKLVNLAKRRVRLPNANIVELEIVKHPGAALIVPFLSKDKIIALKQFRPVINSYIYELPAGTLKEKERPIDCARREVAEETGYRAAKVTKLGAIYPVPGYSTEKIFIFKAERLSREEMRTEADEVLKPCIITKPMAKRLFKSGRLVDAKTICGLAMCGWL